MKELYNEYFHIPKHGKIRDKVMLIRTAITAIIMIVCLAAMSITAYAYFSYNVSSGSNIIKAADFDLNIAVTVTNDETTDTVTATEDNTYTLSNGTYTVSLEKAGTAKTGFCIIEITVGETKTVYHTQQIGKDYIADTDGIDLISFTLDLTSITEPVTVKFTPHWGTSCYYGYENLDSNPLYIKNKGDVKITVGTSNSISESDEEKETTSDETTRTETTPTEVIHTVVAGETLSSIEKTYGVSVDQIAAYNNISNPNSIQAGQMLKIPSADYKVPANTTEQTTTQTTTTEPETTTPPETTAPAETTTETESTGTPETSAPAVTTEPVETTTTTSIEETQPTTENSESTGAPTTEANS